MSTTDNEVKTSPVGEIVFMAGENPVTDKKTGKQHYSIKLAFDVKKDKEWLDWVSSVNSAKVVTERTYRGNSDELLAILAKGKAFVEAKSNFKPEAYDAKGNPTEECPLFFPDSTGTAKMMVTSYQGEKGGTINLVGIIVKTVESPEGSTSSGVSREERLAQLNAMAQQEATKD